MANDDINPNGDLFSLFFFQNSFFSCRANKQNKPLQLKGRASPKAAQAKQTVPGKSRQHQKPNFAFITCPDTGHIQFAGL